MKLELNNAVLPSADDKPRQKILDCARELFLEFGLRRTSMEDVAKKVGIGRATLYRRYSDKNQLFLAVIMRGVQDDLKAIENAIQASPDYLDGLIEAFVLAVQLIHENSLLTRLLQTEPDDVLPSLTVEFSGILGFARDYAANRIEKGQALGQIRQGPPLVIAETMMRLTQSLMLTPEGVINPRKPETIRELAEQFLRSSLSP